MVAPIGARDSCGICLCNGIYGPISIALLFGYADSIFYVSQFGADYLYCVLAKKSASKGFACESYFA
jgi:hypothetical protein